MMAYRGLLFVLLAIPILVHGDERYIDTWIGYAHNDSYSLGAILPYADKVRSVSFGVSSDTDVKSFTAKLRGMGIESYGLVNGGQYQFGCITTGECDLAMLNATARAEAIEGYVNFVIDNDLDGFDMDFEHLPAGPTGGSSSNVYNESLYHYREPSNIFVRELSAALHAKGKKLSQCVSCYPDRQGNLAQWWDPVTSADAVDVVRVMNYDMFYGGGINQACGNAGSRPDCYGFGPTSAAPWAKSCMEYWRAVIPREKMVMNIPAYANQYSMLPGGTGGAAGLALPANATHVEKSWNYFYQLHEYRYLLNGVPHLLYATDTESTAAHLRTASELGIASVGFWVWQAPNGSPQFDQFYKPLYEATYSWAKGGSGD